MPTDNVLDIAAIIPFKGNVEMTYGCVESLKKYGPPIKEIILVSNNTESKQFKKIEKLTKKFKNLSLYKYDKPFNFQKINNWAVKKCSSKNILFVNNDIQFTQKSIGIVESMLKKAQEPNSGLVGTLLLYEDKATIQHAGVYLEPGGMANHMYIGKNLKKVERSIGKTKELPYEVYTERPVTAVTAALSLVEKSKFLIAGGFEESFIIGGGDVDLCIRLNKLGKQTQYLAHENSFIIHKEKKSRKRIPIPYKDYYWSYNSYISAFDLERGDNFLPKASNLSVKSINRRIVNEENVENHHQIERVYPLLPNLKQKPRLNIIMTSSRGTTDKELLKIIKGVELAKKTQMDVNIISNLNFTISMINKFFKINRIDFNLKVTKSMIYKDGPHYIVKLPLHPNDLFYCVKWKDSKMISKLPVKKNMIIKRRLLGNN